MPGRRDQREEEQAPRDVVVLHVRQLVRDDRAHLGRREVLDQVVVEHDALRVPEPADVGVRAGRPPARVHPVDLAHVHAGALGQLEHVGAQLAPSGSSSKSLKSGSITSGDA